MVRKVEHLPQPVRHIQDRDSVRLKAPDDLEKALRILKVQSRGRLIHDEYVKVTDDRFCDFDELLVRDAHRADDAARLRVDAKFLQDGVAFRRASPH